MRNGSKYLAATIVLAIAATDFDTGGYTGFHFVAGFVTPAAAARVVVRRPVVAPVGVAGVARRTTRRVTRRGAYIAAIPAGCAYGSYYGYNLYYCGGTYYQRSGGGYVVVYF